MRTILAMLVCCCIASAQTTINVYNGGRDSTFPSAGYAGMGMSVYKSGGCTSTQMMTGSGCTGSVRMGAGCTGGGGATYYAPSQPSYYVPTAPIPVYLTQSPGRVGLSRSGEPFAYSRTYATGGGIPVYGEMTGRGQWATPSGRPAAPGIISVPDAPFPLDGPVRRGLRAMFGYDY